MLSQQQYTKELAETERYYNSEARRQPSANDNNNNNVGGSSPNNKQQYTDEENEAYNTIINNIKDPQELYQILHKMKQKRLHRTNTNNNKSRRHRYQRQRRSKSKRRVSRSSSGSSEDTPTLDTPLSTTTDRSATLIDTLSGLLFPFHSITHQDTTDNDTLDEQEDDTPASSPFDNIMSFLGYDNSNDAGHYECGSSDSTTNDSCSSSFDSSTNFVDSFNVFNILWNKKKSNSSSREKYRRSSSSSAISPRNVEDSWVTKDELNEW